MIGKYYWCWAGGDNPQYTASPYFARRKIYLPSIRATVLQILVDSAFGGRAWINVRPGDLQ